MHLEHDHHHSSSVHGHFVDVHTTSILHNFELAELTDHNYGHHATVIDVSPDNLVSKVKSLNPLVLILLAIGIFLYAIRLLCLTWQRLYNTLPVLCAYLINPPLRAPPLH